MSTSSLLHTKMSHALVEVFIELSAVRLRQHMASLFVLPNSLTPLETVARFKAKCVLSNVTSLLGIYGAYTLSEKNSQ